MSAAIENQSFDKKKSTLTEAGALDEAAYLRRGMAGEWKSVLVQMILSSLTSRLGNL